MSTITLVIIISISYFMGLGVGLWIRHQTMIKHGLKGSTHPNARPF